MTNRCLMGPGAALAAALILYTTAAVRADDDPPINRGFVPDTGQINPGTAQQPSSQSTDFSNTPTPEEVRAALMMPASKQPSTGEAAATTGTGAQNDQASPSTGAAGAATEPPPSGPIGSFGQTIPAKFSKRNDIFDHVPTMALPLLLTDDQRKQIYDAVMAEKSQVPAGASALKPASELSPDQASSGMHPLPASVRGIDGLQHLYYVKAQGKVLLVEPDVRTVVGEITPGK